MNEIKWLFDQQAEEKKIEFEVEKGNNLPDIIIWGSRKTKTNPNQSNFKRIKIHKRRQS